MQSLLQQSLVLQLLPALLLHLRSITEIALIHSNSALMDSECVTTTATAALSRIVEVVVTTLEIPMVVMVLFDFVTTDQRCREA